MERSSNGHAPENPAEVVPEKQQKDSSPYRWKQAAQRDWELDDGDIDN